MSQHMEILTTRDLKVTSLSLNVPGRDTCETQVDGEDKLSNFQLYMYMFIMLLVGTVLLTVMKL